ncbi:hypothetical protein GCM10010191_10040 [Actinomadura vinacea]|uniref:Uncharacterized protein n=1 Tax=Actinomadura vinacea TaxID=115336 RepID=A0ABP5VL52_9ACTN
MPKVTDYVREGFRRRQRPWDRTELPEWWDVAIWFAVGGVVLMLVAGAALGRGKSSGGGTAGAEPPRYTVQTLDPRGSGAAPGSPGATPSASAAPSRTPPAGVSAKDFTASAAMQVPVTSGGTTVVPAGARNVAMAAAKATATGNWNAIPFVGSARPSPARSPTPQGSVVGEITVADPSVTGNSQYRFSATITHGGQAAPYVVRILVERNQSGYAIRAR